MGTTVVIYDSKIDHMFDQSGQLRNYVQRKVDATVVAARIEAPSRTGALRRSIGSTYHGGGRWTIEAGTNHAKFVHNGTAAHTIRPKTGQPRKRSGRRGRVSVKKVLKFFWQREGRVVYFTSVRHPGTKANPFLVRAMKQVW